MDYDQKGLPADVEATLETAVQAINQCFQLRRQYRTGVEAALQDPRTASSPEIAHPSSTEWGILAFLLRISAIGTDLLCSSLELHLLSPLPPAARQSCLRYTQLRQAPAEWQRLKLDLRSEGSLQQVSVRYVQ
jgi:hypothetical protein